MVTQEKKRFQEYYTTSSPIMEYMSRMLSPKPGDRILEPSAGQGALIDSTIKSEPRASIDAYELNEESVLHLEEKYAHNDEVSVIHANTLLQRSFGEEEKGSEVYDKIIGNPPYGAWLDYSERSNLKTLFPGMYVNETYGLFLAKCVELLKPGGRLVFIIPETFLTLHRHQNLRRFVLETCTIQEISIFPSAYFPGVNFGYAKLCIITLEKAGILDGLSDHEVSIRYDFSDARELLEGVTFSGTRVLRKQRDIYASADHALHLHSIPGVVELIGSATSRLGDLADCVTGFYSGNDLRFLRHNCPGARSAKRYEQINEESVNFSPSSEEKMLGIAGPRHYVPIRKGGSAEYVTVDKWYMDWSPDAVHHYKTDKKSRYQNSQYYFRSGIGVPMVSSTRIKAALIQEELFDQSIVGVFPRDPRLIPYLLAFLNSATGNTLVRTINPTVNNSANYLKKVPVIIPEDSVLERIDGLVSRIIEELSTAPSLTLLSSVRPEVDSIFRDIYGF
ncbi:Eco57I restriction-modification methylase domain-containing protein [Streptomyces sp. NPDC004330]|uniref:Eco57I restriction-modification methylase domain-containing protein n=1 Tax=Streptomyces sp. NPDC004330 TaxID=3364700 RepID=UPI0036C5D00C